MSLLSNSWYLFFNIVTHICICTYDLMSPFSIVHIFSLYIHVSKVDHLVLGILCGSLSLEETNTPSFRSHWWPVAFHPGMWPCQCWHVAWCYHYASLVQATTLLRFHGFIFHVMPRGYYSTIGVLGLWQGSKGQGAKSNLVKESGSQRHYS